MAYKILPLKKKKKWIQGMHMNKGGLHRALGVPEGQNIPAAKLHAALNSKDPHVRRMAQTAKNLEGLG